MSKDNSNIINTIFIMCTLISSILIFTTYLKLQSTDYSYLSSIGKNWENSPITSLKTSKNSCPIGFKPILNNFWSGTHEGCFCSNLKNSITEGKCDRFSKLGLQNGCKNINAIPEMDLSTWKGAKICGKSSTANYLDLNLTENSTKCGKGNKICGVLDTVGNYLCVAKNDKCPINFMKFVAANDTIAKDPTVQTRYPAKRSHFKTTEKYSYINIGQEGKIVFSNEEKNAEIFAEFSLEEKIPCPSLKKKSLIHQPYILEKNFNAEKCDENDTTKK